MSSGDAYGTQLPGFNSAGALGQQNINGTLGGGIINNSTLSQQYTPQLYRGRGTGKLFMLHPDLAGQLGVYDRVDISTLTKVEKALYGL